MKIAIKVMIAVAGVLMFIGCGGGIKLSPSITLPSGSGGPSPGGSPVSSPSPLPSPICDDQAVLSWTPPTENTDGSALTNLAGFNVYYGNSSGSYFTSIELMNPSTATYTITDMDPGTYYFSITAENATGTESAYSSEAVKVLACTEEELTAKGMKTACATNTYEPFLGTYKVGSVKCKDSLTAKIEDFYISKGKGCLPRLHGGESQLNKVVSRSRTVEMGKQADLTVYENAIYQNTRTKQTFGRDCSFELLKQE